MWGGLADQMPLRFLECGRQSRAALLSRAGRPRPACSVCDTVEKADEDVGRGPGGPPHQTKWYWLRKLRPIGKPPKGGGNQPPCGMPSRPTTKRHWEFL